MMDSSVRSSCGPGKSTSVHGLDLGITGTSLVKSLSTRCEDYTLQQSGSCFLPEIASQSKPKQLHGPANSSMRRPTSGFLQQTTGAALDGSSTSHYKSQGARATSSIAGSSRWSQWDAAIACASAQSPWPLQACMAEASRDNSPPCNLPHLQHESPVVAVPTPLITMLHRQSSWNKQGVQQQPTREFAGNSDTYVNHHQQQQQRLRTLSRALYPSAKRHTTSAHDSTSRHSPPNKGVLEPQQQDQLRQALHGSSSACSSISRSSRSSSTCHQDSSGPGRSSITFDQLDEHVASDGSKTCGVGGSSSCMHGLGSMRVTAVHGTTHVECRAGELATAEVAGEEQDVAAATAAEGLQSAATTAVAKGQHELNGVQGMGGASAAPAAELQGLEAAATTAATAAATIGNELSGTQGMDASEAACANEPICQPTSAAQNTQDAEVFSRHTEKTLQRATSKTIKGRKKKGRRRRKKSSLDGAGQARSPNSSSDGTAAACCKTTTCPKKASGTHTNVNPLKNTSGRHANVHSSLREKVTTQPTESVAAIQCSTAAVAAAPAAAVIGGVSPTAATAGMQVDFAFRVNEGADEGGFAVMPESSHIDAASALTDEHPTAAGGNAAAAAAGVAAGEAAAAAAAGAVPLLTLSTAMAHGLKPRSASPSRPQQQQQQLVLAGGGLQGRALSVGRGGVCSNRSATSRSSSSSSRRAAGGTRVVAAAGGGSGPLTLPPLSPAAAAAAGPARQIALDWREEQRRTQERLETYRRAKEDKSRQANDEEAERRRQASEARNAQRMQKERHREEVYAINAILRMSEQAKINLLLEAAAEAAIRAASRASSRPSSAMPPSAASRPTSSLGFGFAAAGDATQGPASAAGMQSGSRPASALGLSPGPGMLFRSRPNSAFLPADVGSNSSIAKRGVDVADGMPLAEVQSLLTAAGTEPCMGPEEAAAARAEFAAFCQRNMMHGV